MAQEMKRFALVLQHKDHTIGDNANTLSFSDYQADGSRFLYLRTADGELVPAGDGSKDELLRLLQEMVEINTKREGMLEPHILFLLQEVDGKVMLGDAGVLGKHHEYVKQHESKLRPHMETVMYKGETYHVLPYLDTNMVYVDMKLETQSQSGSLTEWLEEWLRRVLTHNVEGYEAFRRCWEKVHQTFADTHNRDMNQDDLMAKLHVDTVTQYFATEELMAEIPTLLQFQPNASQQTINVKSYNIDRYYKYQVRSSNPQTDPIVFLQVQELGGSKEQASADFLCDSRGTLLDGYINYSESKALSTVGEEFLQNQVTSNDTIATYDNTTESPLNKTFEFAGTLLGNSSLHYKKIIGEIDQYHFTSQWNTTDDTFRTVPYIESGSVECYDPETNRLIETVPMTFSIFPITSTSDSVKDPHPQAYLPKDGTISKLYWSAETKNGKYYYMIPKWKISWGRVTDTTKRLMKNQSYTNMQYGDFYFSDPLIHREKWYVSGFSIRNGKDTMVTIEGVSHKYEQDFHGEPKYFPLHRPVPSRAALKYHIAEHIHTGLNIDWFGFEHNVESPLGFPAIDRIRFRVTKADVKHLLTSGITKANPHICYPTDPTKETFLLRGGREYQITTNVPISVEQRDWIAAETIAVPTTGSIFAGQVAVLEDVRFVSESGNIYRWELEGTPGHDDFYLVVQDPEAKKKANFRLYASKPHFMKKSLSLEIQGRTYYVMLSQDKIGKPYVSVQFLTTSEVWYFV